jgi:hypothetical protein
LKAQINEKVIAGNNIVENKGIVYKLFGLKTCQVIVHLTGG